jgi:3-oxochol-4-en-24-oyl-CoA dehydrogenase
MNFDVTEEQALMRDMFARYLDEHSSMARVRAAAPSGFDAALWQGLAEQGALAIRVPEAAGGLGLGLTEAVLFMEEAGRTLVCGPLAEVLVAASLLGQMGAPVEDLLAGSRVVTLALHDIAKRPKQWIAGGLVADAVVARRGSEIMLVKVPQASRRAEETLAGTPMAELDLGSMEMTLLGTDVAKFAAGIEEWKLLISAALAGLARQSLKMAAAYASERKQFGQFIGQFQGISHPLADLVCEADGGRLLVWKAIRNIADGDREAGATISLAAWWNAISAARCVAQALHSFGGYGLTTEYDIHLFNLRAKAWPLMLGDPADLLQEAGRRLYAGEVASLPDAGDCPVEFELGEDAAEIAKEIDAFFETRVTAEEREKFHYSWEGFVPSVHKKLANAGLLFPGLPGDLRGKKLSHYAQMAAMDAYEHHGYNNPAANVTQMVALMIHRFGSDELKSEVLPKLMQGEAICSLGYSEPGSGSDVFAAQCKATPDGNGWRIDGTKMFTSGANLSTYVLMLCRTNTEVAKHAGLTMFIVPLKSSGVTVQPVYTFQEERTNITFYDNVRIPDSWRLGEVDGGVKTMSAALELEHGGGFGKYMRKMLEAGEAACREIIRDGQPLIEQPQAQARLARTTAHLWLTDLITFRAQWVIAEKKPNHAYGPMAKMFSSEKFLTDARDLLDLAAPDSLSSRGGPTAALNLFYRHAHGARIYGGTSEVHRSMIAERNLGLPRTRA